MGDRAYSADTLDDLDGVARVSTTQNAFKATIHASRDSGVGNDAILHAHFNLEMPLQTRDRIDCYDFLAHDASAQFS